MRVPTEPIPFDPATMSRAGWQCGLSAERDAELRRTGTITPTAEEQEIGNARQRRHAEDTRPAGSPRHMRIRDHWGPEGTGEA